MRFPLRTLHLCMMLPENMAASRQRTRIYICSIQRDQRTHIAQRGISCNRYYLQNAQPNCHSGLQHTITEYSVGIRRIQPGKRIACPPSRPTRSRSKQAKIGHDCGVRSGRTAGSNWAELPFCIPALEHSMRKTRSQRKMLGLQHDGHEQ
jgi:hypothetical protein